MEGEVDLPAPPAATGKNLIRPTRPDSSPNRPSHSTPDFLRHVQAEFKRRRPLAGPMQSNNLRPRRTMLPQRGTLKSSDSNSGLTADTKKAQDVVSLSKGHLEKDSVSIIRGVQEDASFTQPSISGTSTKTYDEGVNPFNVHNDQPKPLTGCKSYNAACLSHVESQHVPVDSQKKVQFLVGNIASSQGANDQMATGTDNLSSYMGSLALTEMECDANNQVEASTITNPNLKHHNILIFRARNWTSV